jgi:hypothetical protein
MRLQGKRNRGKEEVKFLEIKGDDQLSGNQQWMTKSMTEEKQERKSFSKVREICTGAVLILLTLVHSFQICEHIKGC